MTLAQKLRQEGRISALRENLVDTMELRFGKVPSGLAELVAEVVDEDKLRAMLRSAIRCNSLEEFSKDL